jgi:23S rRNA (cytidine1920-2'-O)/16S rRNA (cytidine1409-2'-O)-methyltransferase
VLAGQVRVDDVMGLKAGELVSDDARVTLLEPIHPYVGRGGVKLAHALDTFGITVRDRIVLDIGASTGGFTDVTLQRGAAKVAALDVGHGQLEWKLRQDSRVTVLERINARWLRPDQLPPAFRRVDLVTIDVSFISLALILGVVPPVLAKHGDLITLVKPQFEAGRAEVGKRGVITDPAVHTRVVNEVIAAADGVGLTQVAVTPSPIVGAEGNKEFLLHLRHATRR